MPKRATSASGKATRDKKEKELNKKCISATPLKSTKIQFSYPLSIRRIRNSSKPLCNKLMDLVCMFKKERKEHVYKELWKCFDVMVRPMIELDSVRYAYVTYHFYKSNDVKEYNILSPDFSFYNDQELDEGLNTYTANIVCKFLNA